MVVILAPDSPNATSLPIASQGIHLLVTQFSPLNPGGVLPVSLGLPIGLIAIMSVTLRRRRKHVDGDGSLLRI